MTPLIPEAITALERALQSCRSLEAERHIRRALLFLQPKPRPARCVRDREPCTPECTVTALNGRCGRD